MSGNPPSGRCNGSVRKIDGSSFQSIHSRVYVATFIAFILLVAVSSSYAGTAVHVSISPASVNVFSALTQQFTATVTNSDNTKVVWSTTKGKVSSTGLYTAPVVSSDTTVSVTATSVADPTKSATATVTVMPPVKVSVTPTGVVMNSGKTQPFKATVTGTVRNGVTWSATEGTISSSGLFTAPTVSTTQRFGNSDECGGSEGFDFGIGHRESPNQCVKHARKRQRSVSGGPAIYGDGQKYGRYARNLVFFDWTRCPQRTLHGSRRHHRRPALS